MIVTSSIVTENELAAGFISDFRERKLSEKFFYWFPLSVRAWLALCSDGEYRNYVRSRSLVSRTREELARLAPEGPLQVLSLGSGQGDKDLLLLEALRPGRNLHYTPVDTSQALLELACAGGEDAGIATEGVKADFTEAAHVAALAAGPEDPPRLVLMFGNTLGSLDPIAAAADLRRLLRPGDLLLVDGELYGGETTLAGYDNSINRAFAWAPLHSVGIREGDGELVFESAGDERRPGLHLIPKHFRAERPLEIQLGGERVGLEAGSRLEMSHSYKYALDTFLGILDEAGMDARWHALSEDDRFVMALAGAR